MREREKEERDSKIQRERDRGTDGENRRHLQSYLGDGNRPIEAWACTTAEKQQLAWMLKKKRFERLGFRPSKPRAVFLPQS